LEKLSRILGVLLFAGVLSACGGGSIGGVSNGELPTVQVDTSAAPDVEATVAEYLDLWGAGDYNAMYAMLSTLSQGAISFEDFDARYTHVEREANLFNIEHEILGTLTNAKTAQVSLRLTLHSAIVGPISRDTTMDLSLENDDWRVAWGDQLILPELVGGNTLSMERFDPARGNIYDSEGGAMAANTQAVAVGVFPELTPEDEVDALISELARLTGRSINDLNEDLFPEAREPDFYVSIAEVSADVFNERLSSLESFSSIRWEYYDTRLYFDGDAGAQTLGYVGSIPAEDVDDYVPLGYRIDDQIGRLGVENWAEEYLSGQRGGALYVISPEGEIVTQLATSQAQAASSVYTTLDQELQLVALEAIRDFTGAVVVLERDTGRVLAMASSPSFNPNWADSGNYNSDWGSYFPDEQRRFFNRATQGQYPPGSIFKVISLAAALESEVFTSNSNFDCALEWNGLPGVTLFDWRLEKELEPSGNLSLLEGLMRSCNPWFYQVGLDLYNADFGGLIAELASGFGLGTETGIQSVVEVAGQVIAPSENPDIGASEAVQQAIGQGSTTITPLQAAVYAAAIGNGGTLYEPQLIDRVENTDGSLPLSFEPQAVGELPISENTLLAMQTGMRMVVTDPRGTAYNRFLGFTIPVFGKTGTASVEGLDPHAWFIGYTAADSPTNPDIAIAVLVENIGDGSEFAAPIFRRIATYHFFNSLGPLYPWEEDFGVLDPVYFDETLADEEGQDGGVIQATAIP
jgi:penicillin-binding protein 2